MNWEKNILQDMKWNGEITNKEQKQKLALEVAKKAIESYNGTCGVWLADGIYYVDFCKRIKTKKQALEIGRAHKQISIFGWTRGNLAYC